MNSANSEKTTKEEEDEEDGRGEEEITEVNHKTTHRGSGTRLHDVGASFLEKRRSRTIWRYLFETQGLRQRIYDMCIEL